MRHLIRIISMLIVATVAVACGSMEPAQRESQPIEPDSNSGGDHTQAGALDLIVNEYDSIDASAGDNTDFKLMNLEAGSVTITVRFDEPTVSGVIQLRDAWGVPVQEGALNLGMSIVEIQDDIASGQYFLKIYAIEGGSQYTVDFEFALPVVVEDDDFYDLGQVQEEPQEERSHRRRHRRREREEDDEEDEPEVVAVEEEPEEPEETLRVRASILTILEASGGSTLYMNHCGSASGLSTGAEGSIRGTSYRARITRITGSQSCEASSSASPSEISSATHVNFE